MKSKQTNFSETILYHSHLLFLRRITDYGFQDYIVDVLQCHIFFYKQSHASFKVVFVLYGMNVVNMNSAKLAITSLMERGVCNIIFLMQCFAPFKNQVNEKKKYILNVVKYTQIMCMISKRRLQLGFHKYTQENCPYGFVTCPSIL